MKLRQIRPVAVALPTVLLPLVAWSCGDASAALSDFEVEPVEPIEATLGDENAEEGTAETGATDEDSSDEPSGEKKSRWGAPVLDTGVDLSKVEVQAKPAPAPSASGHEGHDHASSSEGGRQVDPRVARAVFSGAPPTADELAADDIGYLTVDQDGVLHDFGPLTQGDIVEHTFEIRTVGKAPVTVQQIKTSCGCTVAQTNVVAPDGTEAAYVLGTDVAPGSTLRVAAQLNTDKKRSRVRSVLTVMSSDPRGNLQLQLMAEVQPFFELAPLSLNFGTMKPDQVLEKELTVTSPIADTFSLSVKSELLPPEVTVALEPVEPLEDGTAATWKAKVQLGPNIPEGQRKNYQIVLVSDQPMANAEPGPDGTVATHQTLAYATVTVLGLVSASPHYMSFGLMQAEQEITRTVTVENHDDDFVMPMPTARIAGIQGDFEHPEHATVTVEEVEAGKRYDVRMTMRGPTGLTGTFRGRVIVEVGHPTKKEIEWPFTGVVRDPAPRPNPPSAGSDASGGGER